MPKVSVIVPTYNCAQYIAEAVHSILEQTFQDFEVIVVDDGSTDGTQEIVAGFRDSRIRCFYQANQGAGSARNMGIIESKADLISFLDADDIWLPQKLELQIKALESSPRASVVYTDMYYIGSTDPTLPETFFQLFKWPPPRGKVLSQLVDRNFGHPSVLLIKRNVFEKVGMFDEKLRNCQDYDLLFRLAPYFEFEVVPIPLVKYRFHANQISRNSDSVFVCHIAFFNKALQSPFVDDIMRKKFHSRLAESYFDYGLFFIKKGRLSSAGWEFLASIGADAKRFFSLTLALAKRQYTSKRFRKCTGVISNAF